MKVGKKGFASESLMASIRFAVEFVLKESGVDANDLAKFLGIHYGTLSRIRNGRVMSMIYAERMLSKLLWLICTACEENNIKVKKEHCE